MPKKILSSYMFKSCFPKNIKYQALSFNREITSNLTIKRKILLYGTKCQTSFSKPQYTIYKKKERFDVNKTVVKVIKSLQNIFQLSLLLPYFPIYVVQSRHQNISISFIQVGAELSESEIGNNKLLISPKCSLAIKNPKK